MALRDAERDAAQLLESWWTTPGRDAPLPVEPMALARALGIVVRVEQLPFDEAGKIVIPEDDEPVITLNFWDSHKRQRFTCAHEIGHYIRRQQRGERAGTFIDYRSTLAGLGRDVEEVYANQFAAALLMPHHLVARGFHQGRTVEQLAREFDTSVQAMELRLRNLRLTRAWA